MGSDHHETVDDLLGADRVHADDFAGVLGLHQQLVFARTDEAVDFGDELVVDMGILAVDDVEAGERADEASQVDIVVSDLEVRAQSSRTARRNMRFIAC